MRPSRRASRIRGQRGTTQHVECGVDTGDHEQSLDVGCRKQIWARSCSWRRGVSLSQTTLGKTPRACCSVPLRQ